MQGVVAAHDQTKRALLDELRKYFEEKPTSAEDGIRDAQESRGLGDVYKSQTVRNLYEGGSGPIWLSGVYCTGYEGSIAECRHSNWNVHRCDIGQDVSIVCGNSKSYRYELACTGYSAEKVLHFASWQKSLLFMD